MRQMLFIISLLSVCSGLMAQSPDRNKAQIEDYSQQAADLEENQQFRRILPMGQQARLAYQKETGDQASLELAAIYNTIGSGYYYQYQLDSCLHYVNMAISMLTDLNQSNHPILAKSYSILGEYYARKAENEKTQQYLEKAININTLNFGEAHPATCKNFEQIGLLVYLRMLEQKKALAFFEKARKGYLKHYGPNHVQTILIYTRLGMVYRELKEPDKAVANFNKAVQIAENIGFNNASSYILYSQMGEFYRRNREQAKAITCFERALEITNAMEDKPDSRELGMLLARMMVFYYHLEKNYPAGDTYYYDALKALNYNKEQPEAFSQIVDLTILNFIFRARITIYQNLYDETLEERALDTLSEVSNRVLYLEDFLHQNISSSSQQFVDNYTFYVYEQLMKTLFQKGGNSGRQAFSIAEKAKNRILFQNARLAKADKFAGISEAIQEKEQVFNLEITAFEKQLYYEQHLTDTPNPQKVRTYQDTLFALRRSQEQFLKDLERDFLNYYQLKYDRDLMDIPQVQQKLKPDEALIEYFIGDDYWVDNLREQLSIYGFVVTKDTFLYKEILIDYSLGETIAKMRESIFSYFVVPGQPDSIFVENNKVFTQTAHLLYENLIAPFASNLPQKLLIIPDGMLNFIPFDALVVKPASDLNDLKNHQYLLQKHVISYDYSATVHWQKQSSKSKKPKLVVGAFAPSFKLTSDPPDQGQSVQQMRSSLTQLKYNEEEIERIIALASGDAYHAVEASKESFLENAHKYRILHLATHGKANEKMGDFSFIAFTSNGDSLSDQDRLYVRELYNLDLNADLVVLSACETGLGILQRGDAVISISKGFDYAGAKSTITSLWNIYDNPATVKFMESFYQKLQDGLPKHEALRAVKLETLASSSTYAPYYWAAFVPFGDMSEVNFSGGIPIERYLVIPITLALLWGLYLVMIKRKES